jgi:hypothetical protein
VQYVAVQYPYYYGYPYWGFGFGFGDRFGHFRGRW